MAFSYQAVCFDVDGTFSLSGRPIGRVAEFLRILHTERGVQLVVITNNTSKSCDAYRDQFAEHGLKGPGFDIVTPVKASLPYLRRRGWLRGYLVGTKAMLAEYEGYGIWNTDSDPQFVLVGFDTEIQYEKVREASLLVSRGVPFLRTHRDLACPTELGPIPDCGAISRLIEVTTKVRPRADFGKPGEHFAACLRSVVGVSKRALVVGDRLNTDIRLGKTLGWDTVWINGRTDLVSRLSPGERPMHASARFEEFLANHV